MLRYRGKAEAFFLPYCVRRHAGSQYALLNRRYSPVGVVPKRAGPLQKEAVDPAFIVQLPGLTPAVARLVSWNGSDDLEAVYLYKSSQQITKSEAGYHAYMARLHLLMQLVVES